MRATAAVLILALLAPAAQAWDHEGFKRDIAWLTTASAADYLSTRYALSRCDACYESNPLAAGSLEGTKALGLAVQVAVMWELRRRGHDRAAWWFRWSVVVLAGILVPAWNVWQGNR